MSTSSKHSIFMHISFTHLILDPAFILQYSKISFFMHDVFQGKSPIVTFSLLLIIFSNCLNMTDYKAIHTKDDNCYGNYKLKNCSNLMRIHRKTINWINFKIVFFFWETIRIYSTLIEHWCRHSYSYYYSL